MILKHLFLYVFLIAFATVSGVDREPPVFTYCPDDIVLNNVTTELSRVFWKEPTATDNSGVPPIINANYRPGRRFVLGRSYEIQYKAIDGAWNEAICSFQLTLKRKTCPMYDPPQNGALVCLNSSADLIGFCVVMCNSGFDFVFNPQMVYLCGLHGKWEYFASPGLPYQSLLPWPDCSNTASPSWYKTAGFPFGYYFFDGNANDSSVQDNIKTNFVDLMASPYIPPSFCSSERPCTHDVIDVQAGKSTDHEPPVFMYCPKDIVVNNVTALEISVSWQEPTATDNSGVPPSLSSNRPSGELFTVPGSYDVQYTAKDGTGNEAKCSFRITLKRKTCPLYKPPKHGALACGQIAGDRLCVVICRSGFDFVFNPQMVYYCYNGQWNFFSSAAIPNRSQLPWPDCSNTTGPSWFKMAGFPFGYYFFNGNANDPNVQNAIKKNFIDLMASQVIPPFFFTSNSHCTKDNIGVYAGA